MLTKRSLVVLLVASFYIGFGATYSGDRADARGNQALHINVSVKLEKANVVFDIGKLVLNGDMPFFIGTWIYSPRTSRIGTSKAKLLLSFTETPPTSYSMMTPTTLIVIFKPVIPFKPGIRTESSSPG